MNITQQRQMLKGECFNKLMKLFHPKTDWRPSEFPRDESYREKRDDEAEWIVKEYLTKLENLNKNK